MAGSSVCIGPAVAGSWYPADPAKLARQIDDMLRRVPEPPPGDPIRAVIEPHAGYVYSGPVAAFGFRRLRGLDCGRVLLLGPSHYAGFAGATLPEAERYRTPLGDVEIDIEAIALLSRRPGFRLGDGPFGPEHSLESEIPFLQRVLEPGWRLVPLLIGAASTPADLDDVAEGLRELCDDRTLLVVSSDFTHHGSAFRFRPFSSDVQEGVRRLDMGAIEHIRNGDARGFESYVAETGATICGHAAIGVLLRTLPAGSHGELAAYDTSGNITGDWSHTVSYASLVFPRAEDTVR